jgi:hypothetical protein
VDGTRARLTAIEYALWQAQRGGATTTTAPLGMEEEREKCGETLARLSEELERSTEFGVLFEHTAERRRWLPGHAMGRIGEFVAETLELGDRQNGLTPLQHRLQRAVDVRPRRRNRRERASANVESRHAPRR